MVLAMEIAEACTCAGSIVGAAFAPQALNRRAKITAIIMRGFNFLCPFLYRGSNSAGLQEVHILSRNAI